MSECVFCQIVSGELEGSFVYKGETVSAFMDVNPVNEGHVLVIPNIHCERFSSLDNELAGELFKVGQKVLKAKEDSNIKCEGANLFLSDGELAGQEVPHSHLHIAPRFKDDGHRMGFSHVDINSKERSKLEVAAKKVREGLI